MSRAVIFGCHGTRLTPSEISFFKEADPWGFILFARNVESPDQLRALTGELREAIGRDCLVMVDQEGGRVARLRAPHWQEWPDVLEQIAINPSMDAIQLRYCIIGAELLAVGIDTNCIPVLDVARNNTHPFLKSRCFGFDAETVTVAGRAGAAGLMSAGVLPVIKHIPGHGLGVVDSHEGLPVVDASLEALRETDFKPFQALNHLPMGMTSHVVYSQIDEVAGTLSAPVIDLIRTEIGFDGLLMTDDLSMGALEGSHGSRAERALGAGCDMILHCSGDMAHMVEIAQAVPILAGERERRANMAVNSRQTQDIVDIEAAIAEYGRMLKVDS